MHPQLLVATLAALLSTSCGAIGGASLVLKAPIADQCKSAGLKGCNDMTDGVLLVVEGKKAKGLKKVGKGAAKNSPEELKQFASGLKLLGDIPGAAQYMGPVLEVVAYLEESPGSGGAVVSRTAGRSDADVASGAAEDTTAPDGRSTVLTAATDADRRRTGMIYPSDDDDTGPCGTMSESKQASCVSVLNGPGIVTDLIPAGDCAFFVASRDSINDEEDPSWIVRLPTALHGAQLFAPSGDSLFLGVDDPDDTCSIVWSAFVPHSGGSFSRR